MREGGEGGSAPTDLPTDSMAKALMIKDLCKKRVGDRVCGIWISS